MWLAGSVIESAKAIYTVTELVEVTIVEGCR